RPVRCSGRDADDDAVVRPEFDVAGDPSGKGDGSSGDGDLALEGTLGRGTRDAFAGRTEADSFDLDGAGPRVYAARWAAAVGLAVTVGDLAVVRVVERRRGVTQDQYSVRVGGAVEREHDQVGVDVQLRAGGLIRDHRVPQTLERPHGLQGIAIAINA